MHINWPCSLAWLSVRLIIVRSRVQIAAGPYFSLTEKKQEKEKMSTKLVLDYEDIMFSEEKYRYPRVLGVKMPQIPAETANPVNHVLSQLEEILNKSRFDSGQQREYQLRLDLDSYQRFCAQISPLAIIDYRINALYRLTIQKLPESKLNLKLMGVNCFEPEQEDFFGVKYQEINFSFYKPLKKIETPHSVVLSRIFKNR